MPEASQLIKRKGLFWLRVLEVSVPAWLTMVLQDLLPGNISCQECVEETAVHLKKDVEKEGGRTPAWLSKAYPQ